MYKSCAGPNASCHKYFFNESEYTVIPETDTHFVILKRTTYMLLQI